MKADKTSERIKMIANIAKMICDTLVNADG